MAQFKLLLRRGTAANLPTLAEGEPGFTTDTKKLYIGSATGNVQIGTQDAVSNVKYNATTRKLQKTVNGTDSDIFTADNSPVSGSANPITSGAVYTALAAKAPLASPALTGTPTAPTAASSTNTTQIATTAFVKTAVAGLSGVLHYKGTKATVSALPTSGNTQGDVWLVSEDSSEHIWNGSQWEKFGPNVDLSDYAPLASPAFTGTPTAPTPTSSSGATQIATKGYVDGHTPDLSAYMQKGTDYVTAGLSSGTAPVGTTIEGRGHIDITQQYAHIGGVYSKEPGVSDIHIELGDSSKATVYYDSPGVVFFEVSPESGDRIIFKAEYTDSSITFSYLEGLETKYQRSVACLKYSQNGMTIESSKNYYPFNNFSVTFSNTDTMPISFLQLRIHTTYYDIADLISTYMSITPYLEMIGNGAGNSRSNARFLDIYGNETLAGKLTLGSAPTNNMDAATKQYVDDAISSAIQSAMSASY